MKGFILQLGGVSAGWGGLGSTSPRLPGKMNWGKGGERAEVRGKKFFKASGQLLLLDEKVTGYWLYCGLQLEQSVSWFLFVQAPLVTAGAISLLSSCSPVQGDALSPSDVNHTGFD